MQAKVCITQVRGEGYCNMRRVHSVGREKSCPNCKPAHHSSQTENDFYHKKVPFRFSFADWFVDKVCSVDLNNKDYLYPMKAPLSARKTIGFPHTDS